MREIKFQVFTTDWEGVTGCFEGYFLQLLDNGECKVAFTNSDNDKDIITTERENIRFFTGLKDKNNKGKEIFEGDIVEFNNCDYLRTGGYLDDEILRGKVIFAYGGWMIKTNKGDYDLYQSIFNDEELEVIGNVFEDSHLLEEQNG